MALSVSIEVVGGSGDAGGPKVAVGRPLGERGSRSAGARAGCPGPPDTIEVGAGDALRHGEPADSVLERLDASFGVRIACYATLSLVLVHRLRHRILGAYPYAWQVNAR